MKSEKYVIQGFKASAVASGLKKNSSLDLALILSEKEATAAGVFTTNKVKAAPVILSREHIKSGKARAIIANAGYANACTGETGLINARQTADFVAKELAIQPYEVLIASTGVIGQLPDIDLISGAIPDLAGSLSLDNIPSVARAIMTTDSFPKISRFDGQAGRQAYEILGIAKGAGMIMPNMATMLCFVLSDIRIDANDLKESLISSVETTFNRITVDGDTSTNDAVMVMANGTAGNKSLSEKEHINFTAGLKSVMGDLAGMIVRDGEGATKMVRIEILDAHSSSDAIIAARTVANSSLVKTAFYGQDPNWGRIMAALGRAEVMMEEKYVDIWIDDVQIVSGGLAKGIEAERQATEKMAQREFGLTINLHQGAYKDQIITCDLTHDYVTINADYRT